MTVEEILIDDRQGLPSASKMERLMLCPGSWQLEQGITALEIPSQSALDGTMLHEVLAGIRVPVGLNERQQYVVDKCRELRAGLEQQLGFEGEKEGRRWLVEERLWYYDPEQRPVFSGQVDFAVTDGKRGLVVDYKTGTGPVTRSGENYQMRASAVLMAHNFELEEVFVSIIQPLADPPIAIARYGIEELLLAENDIMSGLNAAVEPNPIRIAGDPQCRYCRAKSVCPEVHAHALSVVPPGTRLQNGNGKLTLPTLTGEQLSELLPRLDIAERVIRELRRQAKDILIDQPDAIAGYKLKPGGERRSIPNTADAYAKLATILTPEQFAACCSVQIGKLEEILRIEMGETVAGARLALIELLGEVIERKTAEASLERSGDSNGNTGPGVD